MGIFSRTRDIIAANMTDLLDKAEDPAKMIRMIIMEMEETLVEVRASAARTIADQKEMRRQIAKLERSEEHTSELQSLMRISYAVFCLKKTHIQNTHKHNNTTTKNTQTAKN